MRGVCPGERGGVCLGWMSTLRGVCPGERGGVCLGCGGSAQRVSSQHGCQPDTYPPPVDRLTDRSKHRDIFPEALEIVRISLPQLRCGR